MVNFYENRLEIAKALLHDTGSIFVQIDDFEDSYIRILLDEIFGKENFRNKITWKRRGGSANPSTRLNNVVDYILWYSKKPETFSFTPLFSIEDENTQNYIKERFTNELDGRKFMLAPIERNAKLGIRENLRYEYQGYIPKYGWMVSKEKLMGFDKENKLHWNNANKPNRRVFLDEYRGQPVSCLWTDLKVINPMSKERTEFDSGQKPETLIQRILEMCSLKDDLILDFFSGSGTTAATAHKMGRQYIGIEQMNYIKTITTERLAKVLEGDQSGISKSVDWQGGGDFIYLELAQWNEKAKAEMLACESLADLEKLFERLYESYFLNYNLKVKEFKEKVMREENFRALSLDEQKKIFLAMLDLNQLYVQESEMADHRFGISEKDQALTKAFYYGE